MPTGLQPCGGWATALNRNKAAARPRRSIQRQVMMYLVLFVILIIGLLWLFQVVLLGWVVPWMIFTAISRRRW